MKIKYEYNNKLSLAIGGIGKNLIYFNLILHLILILILILLLIYFNLL
jgi:hypothetical protein